MLNIERLVRQRGKQRPQAYLVLLRFTRNEARSILNKELTLVRLKIVEYNTVDELWGWGIRYNFETWCYNVKGDHGIRIRMKDGEQLLIGTQKAQTFQNLLKELGR